MNRKLTIEEGLHAREHGQAMVEFMLVIIVLFLLFASVVQVMLLMYAYSTLADAAKEGVRYAIVHGTGNSSCSGPSTSTICPTSDTTAANVKAAVLNFGCGSCATSANALAGISFQSVGASDVTVDYNPNNANGLNPCSLPTCMVRVTVSHAYSPFFGLPWPTVTLNAAADGRIMN